VLGSEPGTGGALLLYVPHGDWNVGKFRQQPPPLAAIAHAQD